MKNSIIISEVSPEQLKEILKAALREILKEDEETLPNKIDDNLMDGSEVQKMLHISKMTLYEWRKKKLIPYLRIARRIYYKKHEVLKALETLPKYKGRR